MNFIEQTMKKTVDHMQSTFPDSFSDLTYPEKCQTALKLFMQAQSVAGDKLPPKLASQVDLLALIIPFVWPSTPDAVIRSVSLTTEKQLINDLAGSELPTNIDTSYYRQHDQFDNWFIQLPTRSFLYSDDLWLSGIFYIPSSGITAIICQSPSSSDYIYAIEKDCSINTVSNHNLSVDTETVQRARILVQLLILHYDSKRQQQHSFSEQKTYPSHSEASPKKRGKRNLKYSLFRTINIDYQGDYERSGIPPGITRKPLDHSFSVRGHFRWQAYGKKLSKRKLLWIDSFIKGTGEFDTRAQKIKL